MYTILIDGDSIAYGAACISVDKESFELDMMLCQSQINAKMHEILTACNTRSYEIYVESRFNKCIFRNSIAVTKPYKGNRKAPLPEETYKLAVIDAVMDAKEHLIKQWNAVETREFESEDKVIQRAYKLGKRGCIIAAIDKDMYNYPFNFYNYRTGEFEEVGEELATKRLWMQVATGDSTDHIPGIKGIGKAKAAHINDMSDCVQLYHAKGHSYEYFIEQYNLIYIRKEDHTDVIYPVGEDEWRLINGV